jgi:hypothetical protein
VLSTWDDTTLSGRIYWAMPREAVEIDGSAFHFETARSVVEHVDSPLAVAATEEAIESYRHRWGPHVLGERR